MRLCVIKSATSPEYSVSPQILIRYYEEKGVVSPEKDPLQQLSLL